jgi:integrase
MHFPKPWWRESEQAFYVQLGKKQYRLGRTRDEAKKKFQELLALDLGPPEATPRVYSVRTLCKLFLRRSRRVHTEQTRAWYLMFLKSFCRLFGARKFHQLKPLHLDVWIERHPGWGEGTQRCAVVAIKAVLNWGKKKGLFKEHPLQNVPNPPPQRRERVLSSKEHEQIFSAIKDEAFREFVLALRETGCRPGEVMKLTASDVSPDCSMWIITKHKTKKRTGRVRVVYLTPTMQQLTKKLLALYPTGPLFRRHLKADGQKRPWTPNAIRCRFRRLRKKLSLEGVVAYTYRSSYTTDALIRGVPAAVVAELQGNSVEMIEKHYAFLTPKADILRQAAMQAVSRDPNPTTPARIPEGTPQPVPA